MEKNGAVAIGASKVAGEEAPVEASKAAAVPVLASVIAASDEAPAGLGKIPLGWDPYESVDYIRPENPYDNSITDPWSEEDSSDVRSDEESKETKTRHVLRRLKFDQYNKFFTNDVYRCRKLHATEFNSLVKHAKDARTCGESVNVHGFRSKQQVLGILLHNLQKVAIEEGRMPLIKPNAPKVKGLGNKKWRRHQTEEAEAMRGH